MFSLLNYKKTTTLLELSNLVWITTNQMFGFLKSCSHTITSKPFHPSICCRFRQRRVGRARTMTDGSTPHGEAY